MIASAGGNQPSPAGNPTTGDEVGPAVEFRERLEDPLPELDVAEVHEFGVSAGFRQHFGR